METAAEGETLFRKLAAEEPRRYVPELCRCLRALSDIQSDAGYSKRALSSMQQCIQIGTPLSNGEPGRYLLDRAHDYLSLSRRLRSVPRPDDAQEAAETSVALFREGVKLNAERHLEQLGWALNHLSTCRIECGRPQEAIAAAAESLRCMRTAVRRSPAKNFVPATVVLRNAAWLHARAKKRKKARLVAEQAVRICRNFRLKTPTVRSRVELARALTGLSFRRREAGDHTGALSAMREAVAEWRSLADNSSDHKLDFAASLEDFSSIEASLDKASAVRSRQEAHLLYETIWQLAPALVGPRIADNLQAMSDLLPAPKHSLGAVNDAIRIFERYAPESYFSLHKLPGAFERKGTFLKRQGIILGQIHALRKEARVRERLMDEQVDGALRPLIATLEKLASAYREMGRLGDALTTIEQAKSLSTAYADWLGKAQVAKIDAFDRSALPFQELIRRRVSALCRSVWRALRTYGGIGAVRALS
jgi:tetratricopeptide (TPR) repeat protein